ncbi:hypothetical protein J2778_006375 [Paraburkholderia graminis]|nr:NIPSNAP family protein [Paraburkholderia graminis]MDR6478868.1 hypothetical protein [Paraburkholderia graminis]
MKRKAIVDLRIYTMRQGGVPEFLRLAKEIVVPVQLRHIGPPVAYYVTEIGPQQEVMHLWEYDDLGDMEARRKARNGDPDWPQYAVASDGLITKQETSILRRLSLPDEDGLVDSTASKPVVEFIVTTVQRSRIIEFQRVLRQKALKIQQRHVCPPISLYRSEVGHLNQIVQLWGFDNYADLEARRLARSRDSEWNEYLEAVEPMIVDEHIRILRRVPVL